MPRVRQTIHCKYPHRWYIYLYVFYRNRYVCRERAAMADSAKVENESENGSEEQNRTDGSVNGSGAAFVCLTRFAGDSAAGAVMGSIFGYGPFFSTPSSRLYQTHLVSSHLGCFFIWGLLHFFRVVVFLTMFVVLFCEIFDAFVMVFFSIGCCFIWALFHLFPVFVFVMMLVDL